MANKQLRAEMVKALLLRFPFNISGTCHLPAFRRWTSAGGMPFVAADFIRDLTIHLHPGIGEVARLKMVDFVGSCRNLRRLEMTILFNFRSSCEVARLLDLARLRNKLPQLQLLSEFKISGCGA
jgi:hypothetical protein